MESSSSPNFGSCVLALDIGGANLKASDGIALPRLGMIISLPLLIFISSLAGDEFKLKEVIINIVILTVGSWLVFIKGLNLVIPLWPTFMTA